MIKYRIFDLIPFLYPHRYRCILNHVRTECLSVIDAGIHRIFGRICHLQEQMINYHRCIGSNTKFNVKHLVSYFLMSFSKSSGFSFALCLYLYRDFFKLSVHSLQCFPLRLTAAFHFDRHLRYTVFRFI